MDLTTMMSAWKAQELVLFLVMLSIFLWSGWSQETCDQPLGIENGLINNSQMVAMNHYNNDRALYGAHLARLHGKTGYRADKDHPKQGWITVDFGRPVVISEIRTQGYGDNSVSEWITKFKLYYAFKKLSDFKPLKDSTGKEMIFIANKDRSSVRQNKVPIPVIAKKIMVVPVAWHNNVGLRMEIYGCETGYSFNVWLMSARTPFTKDYFNESSEAYINTADLIMSEVTAQMELTYGYLYATLLRFSPQSHPSTLQTNVVAEIKINCLPQKEELLAGKLEMMRKNLPNVIEPSFFELQYTDKCECPPPKVRMTSLSKSVQNATIIYTTMTKPLLEVYSEFDAVCDTKIMLVSWEVTYITKSVSKFYPIVRLEDISIANSSNHSVNLRLLKEAELVYVRCKVKMIHSQGATGYDYGFFRMLVPDLVANITGTSKVPKNEDAILDGSKSFDPVIKVIKNRFMRFQWSCKKIRTSNAILDDKKGIDDCNKYIPRSSSRWGPRIIRIKTNKLDIGNYIFALTVSKRNRRMTSRFIVTILPPTVIKISCHLCYRRISTNESVTFGVTCHGNACNGSHIYKWNVYRKTPSMTWIKVKNLTTTMSNDDEAAFTIESVAELTRHTNIGNERFRAEVIRVTESDSTRDAMEFIINDGPRLINKTGGCSITPSLGIGVSTVFNISCTGWYDEDPPLLYHFVYHEQYGTVIFHSGYDSFKVTTLPPGREMNDFDLKVQASIRDHLGSETKLDLTVKVKPSYDLSDFHRRYKNFTRTASTLVKEGQVDTTAENALSLIQTAEKVLPKEDDQVKLKDTVLTSIQGISLKTIPQVSKVVAIVALATNRTYNLKHRVRKRSLNLLQKSLTTMGQLQDMDSFGDLAIAKNITTTLMIGIERVIMSSIVEQDSFSKNDTKSALEITNRAADALLAMKRVGDPPSVIKTKTIEIMVYRAKPDALGGKEISEGNGGVKLPSKDVLFGKNKSVPFVDFQMITHANNPYTWGSKSSFIYSGVLDITLKQKSGKMSIENLEKPISLSIPRDKGQIEEFTPSTKPEASFFIKPSNGSNNFRNHPFKIESESHTVEFEIIPEQGKTLEVFVRARRRPTDTEFNYTTTMPLSVSCNDSYHNCMASKYKLRISSQVTGMTGLHYLGLRYYIKDVNTTTSSDDGVLSRERRDCRSSNGRQKRSCVGVKDPPTTPAPTPVTVIPTYNPLTDVNYTLTSTVSFCGYWDEEEEQWSSRGCQVGEQETNKEVTCLCNHLSAFGGDFFVAPNPIDFDKVFLEFGRLGETGNYVVLSTVCVIWALYLLGLLIARKADKRDKDKIVIQVIPSGNESIYCYKISIETGMWYGNGTTADVIIDLHGTEGSSGPLHLNNSDSDKHFFSRSSINIFYVSLPQSLGKLNQIKVAHNNGGTDPSWYLKDVFVVDMQSHSKWYFVADRWIAVHKNDGKLECMLKQTSEKEKIPFMSAFRSRMSKKLGESHLWISLFSQPPQNPFTRCQRLSCCISVLFAAMITSAMFFRFGIESKDTIHIGSFKISWTEIKIGIQSALIAFPVNILIVTLFKNIKQPQTDSDIEQNIKQPGFLPRFFLYITWVLCVAVALVSSAFVVFYSLTWGATTSNQWLTSIMVSFCQDSFVIQPIKIVCITFLLSMIFRKADDHEAVLESPTVIKTSSTAVSYDTPSPHEIEKSRNFKSKRLRLSLALLEMFLFFIFVVLLFVVVYGNRGSARFRMTSHLEKTFAYFEKITNESMFWTWTKEHFLQAVFNVTWYNNKAFLGPEGFLGCKSMFLVGMPRLRQIRVKPDYECIEQLTMVRMLHFTRCFYYSADNEETSKYNWMDWTPILNETDFKSEFQLKRLCPKPWRYKTARELQTLPINGKYKSYYGGGYVADLGYNFDTAAVVISKLQENNWMDFLTVAVLTEFTVFEPSTQLFSIVKLLYERLPTGGANLVPSVQTIPVYFRKTGSSSIVDACQPLFMLVVLFLFILELIRLFFQRCHYLKDGWNWLTLCQCFGSMGIVVIFFFKQKFASAYVKKVQHNPFETTSSDILVFWTDVEMYTISFVMFATTIKCLRLFRFVPQICQMTNTLKSSGKFLCSHISSFIVVILAFTQLASTIFGAVIPTYATFIGTVSTLLQQLVGGRFYFTSVRSVDPILGPIFTFSYIFISTVILVNMFIAILNETYAFVRIAHTSEKFPDAELGEFLLSMIKKIKNNPREQIWHYMKSLTWGRKGKYEFQSKSSKTSTSQKPSKSRKFSRGIPRMKLFKSQTGSYNFKMIDQGNGYCYQVIPQEVLLTPDFSDNITGISYKPFTLEDVLQNRSESNKKQHTFIDDDVPRLATFDSEGSLEHCSLNKLDFNAEDEMKKGDYEFVKSSFEDIRGDLISLSTLTLTNDSAYDNCSLLWEEFSDSVDSDDVIKIYHL